MLALVILLFLGAMLAGLDLGFAMILAAVVGVFLHDGQAIGTTMLATTTVAGVDSFVLVTIPLFVLAGELMNRGGLSQRLVDWSLAMIGFMRGALSQASMLVNTVMAGISGSAAADASAVGAVMIPAMRRKGYGDGYAGAVIAAGAMLGPIIPPSIPMIVYGAMANVSIVRMFLSGVVPGLLLVIGYMAICAWIARRRNYPVEKRTTGREKLIATRHAAGVLLLPVIIIGGIRFGLVTETEAAAVAALYALVVSVVFYRSIGLRDLGDCVSRAAVSSSVVLFLLAAAGPFAWLLAESHFNQAVAATIGSATTHPLMALLLINIVLLLVGCVLEPLPAMIIFLPALIPVGHGLGLDPIHFGAVMVFNLMIGMIHPPIGLLIYIVSAVGKLPAGKVARETLPFLGWALTVLVLITVFPPLTTWLPSMVR
ncbi:TRAP transporter large permease [Ramlibacter sp.]|uniref:TRAP transporter large permease n=1 Tax=Ramlibacter sp. TaxID=1917967 RepID=UPI003D137092